MTTDPLVEVTGLRTTFDTPKGQVRAVDGVSLTVGRGERVGIVGESGSGKSVLVRTLMNLFRDDPLTTVDGQVVFAGENVREMTRERRRHFWGRDIAMVFQNPMTSLNPVKRIGVQITDPMRFHLGMSRRDAREAALDLLVRLGIPAPRRRIDQYPHELSGGMRQRMAIAVALSCNPKLLLADEPTTALDVTVQKQILNLLDRLVAERGMSVVLISHDLGVVAGRTDRVAVMYAGEVVEMARPHELFRVYRHPYTRGLLNSAPRLGAPKHTRLEVIGGLPPDLAALPPGCRFAARCPQVQPRCLAERPPLVAAGPRGHVAACHFPVGTPAGDEALERNRDSGVAAVVEEMAS
ncbi:ABC transporter ATP-binding protein [Phytohabitans sp. ZYX-F-186]|uniref:ABC transporter ATP-binding protein n=1 Tax=Phytohabitans maris TaxID=3071409 RepID=A0ABU0ZBH9_9ACTN|nr:ABC transporter ATP-binding protein [Phytohabitans sp. ZYX-F-186]MDQ7903711.1 ABC transporter ATP-binding protein [Phytohabitans sp. ZYX-F-186]